MLNQQKYFVTGTGTNVGKTIVSAILVNALKADYWKPVQCGDLDNSDSDFIRKNSGANVFPERYRLQLAASPHLAAKMENIKIETDDFEIPVTGRKLIIEGAGGMLVPLNEKNDYVSDIAVKFNLPLIIVSAFYLGSINHTLLTLKYAQSQGMDIALLIFSGDVTESSLTAIKNSFPEIKIAFIPHLEKINKESIQLAAQNFKSNFLS